MHYKVILNKKIWFIIIVCINISAVFIRYAFLSEAFLFDSPGILDLEKQGSITGDFGESSFSFVAKSFSYINFFDIRYLLDWSIYISFIFLGINFLLLKDIYIIELKNLFVILIGMFLWYLFSVGISKEIIQTIFYLSIYIIICNNCICKTIFSKVMISIVILFISAILFRSYYILIAFFSGIIYLMFIFFRKKSLCGIKNYIYSIILFVCVLAIFLSIIEIIFPLEYEAIINLRNEGYRYLLEGGTDSFISNIFDGDSIYFFLLNYIINYFRLLIPIELVFIGKLYYIPYIIYQCAFTYFYVKNLCQLNKIEPKKFISIIFLTSFILVSVIMEPDFGSWIRHQTACYMLLILLIK